MATNLASSSELSWLGVARLAELLRRRELSPTELVRHCLARIEVIDGGLRAFASLLPEATLLEEARRSEVRLLAGESGPLEGVPLAVKDNRHLRGLPTSYGSRTSSAAPLAHDSEVVRRLRAAGAVVVGKTALPEFAAVPVTESLRLGQTRNPWALGLTPGGSSGGSAAAVAAGLVPAAEGNDGAGSLRIPGSCCGLFALKPSRGLIALDPEAGDGLGGLVGEGFLTRSVADTALLLDSVTAAAPDDPLPRPPGRLPFTAASCLSPGPLRVGFSALPPLPAELDAACQQALTETVAALRELGHEPEPVDPGWRDEGAVADFHLVWAVSARLSLLAAAAGGGDPRLAELHVLELARRGEPVEAAAYLAARSRLQRYVAGLASLWERHDLLLTPTLARLPLRIGELFQPAEVDGLAVPERSDRFSPFTAFANLSGQPAAQLPVHWHDGVPVGAQLIGRWGEDAALLQLSAQLEAHFGWTERRPAAFA